MRKPHFELVSVHVEFIRLDCTLDEVRVHEMQSDTYLLWSDDPQTCLTLTPAGDYRVTGDLAVVQVTPLPDPASYYPDGKSCLGIEFERLGQEMFADDLDALIQIARRNRHLDGSIVLNDVFFYAVYHTAEFRSGDSGDVDIEYTFAGELPMDRLLTIVRPNLNRDVTVVRELESARTRFTIHRDNRIRCYVPTGSSKTRLHNLLVHPAWERTFNLNTATTTYDYTHIPADVASHIQLLQDRVTAAHKLVSLYKDAIRAYLDDPSPARLKLLSQMIGKDDIDHTWLTENEGNA